MGFWKKQHAAEPPLAATSARPASRRHADEARRKAQHYTDLAEQPGQQKNDRLKATQQREQAEREMAALRAKTLQARRLAGQIENLHQQPIQAKRKGRIMSTTIADPGQAQRMARRTSDKPSPAGGQLNFNPLHPSMELPPEQLIRLLGLEHKTKRRKKKTRKTRTVNARINHDAEDAPASEAVKLSLPETTPASAERERDIESTPFGDSQKRLIVPALIVGAVAGIAISAYLFWGGSEDTAAVAKQSAPAAEIKAAVPAAAPESTPATRQGLIQRDKVIPQFEIKAEEKRLRIEAEQRYSERMTEQETVLPPYPLIDDIPGPASLTAEYPESTDKPLELPVTPNEAPVNTATPPEQPASLEFQSDGLKDEASVESLPTEQQVTETNLTPVEDFVEVLADPVVETAPVAAEPAPEAGQEISPEAAVDEALF
ncbi:hypothetical protein MNBD_GAMMA15-1348 [hydrothermal vent metagenome]|uniref:Uncharacterized protein n=1 Tax=hydrothermal vent metagenome TaxID=652676 RepID=A0A3B0YC24_9ZZZZ